MVYSRFMSRVDLQNKVDLWFFVLYSKDKIVLRFSYFGRTRLFYIPPDGVLLRYTWHNEVEGHDQQSTGPCDGLMP